MLVKLSVQPPELTKSLTLDLRSEQAFRVLHIYLIANACRSPDASAVIVSFFLCPAFGRLFRFEGSSIAIRPSGASVPIISYGHETKSLPEIAANRCEGNFLGWECEHEEARDNPVPIRRHRSGHGFFLEPCDGKSHCRELECRLRALKIDRD